MGRRLRALLVEDSADDALLVVHQLERGGFTVVFDRVETETALKSAFDRMGWDIVICDYELPGFDAFAARSIVEARDADIPFLIVSGVIDVKTAIEAMRAGVHDYLLKGDLARLGAVVERELAHARTRRARLTAEEALRASEAQYQDLYHNAPDMLASVAANTGRIVQCNRTLATALGSTPENIIGTPVLDLVHPRSEADLGAALTDICSGRDAADVGLELQQCDGSVLDVSMHGVLVPDEKRDVYVRCAFRDIAERKRSQDEIKSLEEQFWGAQRLESVGRLAAGIAHDFNNVLCVIKGYSNFLLEEHAEGTSRQDVLAIQRAADRATGLTQQLLAFGRRQILRPEVIRVDTLIEEFSAMMRPLIGEDITLVCRPAAEPLFVNGDRGQLDQVLMNLAVNARDAMSSGGTLVLETGGVCLDDDFVRLHPGASPGPCVMLGVADSGVGMDQETVERIFEPFFTTKGPGEGTGLGLATVYGIVKQSGGSIWPESEVGHGTTFRVYLPRAAPADIVTRQPRQRPTTLMGTECVLIVEDEEAVRQLARRALRRKGYAVLEAKDASAAEQVWSERNGRIDLLLTDVVMPETTGVELAARLRASWPGLRVLYMSGYVGHPTVEQCVLEHGALLVSKPFTADTLLTKIREALDS